MDHLLFETASLAVGKNIFEIKEKYKLLLLEHARMEPVAHMRGSSMDGEANKAGALSMGLATALLQEAKNDLFDKSAGWYSIGFLEKGESSLKVGKQLYWISAGEIFFLASGRVQASLTLKEHSICKMLYVAQPVMEEFARDLTAQEGMLTFTCSILDDVGLPKKFRNLFDVLTAEYATAEMEIEELFLLLLMKLLQECSNVSICDTFSTGRRSLEEQLALYQSLIKINYSRNLTLKQVADFLGGTRTAVLLNFIRILGISPYWYMASTRIQEAQMLLQRKCSLEEIMVRTGFTDILHFRHVFQSIVGMTADEYRIPYLKV